MMYLMPPGGVLPGKFFSKSVYLTISLSLSLDRLRPTNFCLHHQSIANAELPAHCLSLPGRAQPDDVAAAGGVIR